MTALERPGSQLPAGVRQVPLRANCDRRGSLTEVFRSDWTTGVLPIQWNLMRSRGNTLRGVHVHPQHDDYLVVVQGRMTLGLADLRSSPYDPTLAATLDLGESHAVVVPHGVAHGFHFPVDTVVLYGVTHLFDPSDELGCSWDDPDLGIPWDVDEPILSERDVNAPTLHELLDELARRGAR